MLDLQLRKAQQTIGGPGDWALCNPVEPQLESIPLATAQTPEEFGICVVNIEQKLHTKENESAAITTVEKKGVPDATAPR